MKKWNKPQLLDLDVRYTEGGGGGVSNDGVQYDVFGWIVFGTSGPPIDDPDFIPVS